MQGLRLIIERLSADRERRAAETFRFMEEQRIKKVLAPKQWEELRESLQKECKSLERQSDLSFLIETPDIDSLKITNAKSGRQASFAYNPDVPCISFKGYDDGGYFGFMVSADGISVQLFDVKRTVPTSVNEITLDVMQYLVRTRR